MHADPLSEIERQAHQQLEYGRQVVKSAQATIKAAERLRCEPLGISERDQQIWVARQNGQKLDVIAKQFNLSKSSISQILSKIKFSK